MSADAYKESTLFDGCLYHDLNVRNGAFFEYHSFSLVVAVSVASMLLFSNSLLKFYIPLARIANAAIILQLCSDIAFFMYYPYSDNQGNCAEMFIGRLYIVFVAFGEMHQIYLLANMLGLGNYKFFRGYRCEISLDSFLKASFMSLIVSILYATVVYNSFTLMRNFWCIFVSMTQLYFVRLAKLRSAKATDQQQYLTTSSSIRIFEKISFLQLLPAMLCFGERLLFLGGIDMIPHFDGVTMVLDVVCNLLFYLKLLLIKENSDLTVEVVNL